MDGLQALIDQQIICLIQRLTCFRIFIMNKLIFYTQLLYLKFICPMRKEKTYSIFCKFIGVISIITIPLSVIYSIYWLLGLSLILTVIAYSYQKDNIQQFVVKTVILFRCSCSSYGWVKLGSFLKQTKFDGRFAFPTQADTVHILLLINQMALACSLIQCLEDKQAIWMAKKYIYYCKQKQNHQYRDKQSQPLLEKLFRNYFHYSLQQKIASRKIQAKWIQDVVSVALDYRISKALLYKDYFSQQNNFGYNFQDPSRVIICQKKKQLQIPAQTYYQTQSYLKHVIEKQEGFRYNFKQQGIKQITLQIYRQNTQISTHNSSISHTFIDNRFLNEEIHSIRGLSNLGNTCYMNSAIQCLHKSFELTKAIQEKGKLKSPFISEYLKLMEQLSKYKHSSCYPRQVKQLVSRYNSRFEGYQQQDSCQLLSTLLNYIHDQLNEVKSQNYHNIDKNTKRTDQELLEQYIKKDQSRSKSVIDDIFYGRFLTTYKCLECPGEQKLFQKFNIIYLPVLNKLKQNLQQCMRQFCRPDQLRGDGAWFCSNCQSNTPTDKTMSVYQANKILVICLKRFDQNSKINSLIQFDHQITLTQITNNPKIENLKYDLYGVINHYGRNLNHGHYYSYCKVGKVWKEYDDGHVSKIKQNSVVSSNAFVLLYRLRG